MILVGNQRGGAKDLALHLLKDENERVEVHELRGFASDNLVSALRESYAISRATRCKQHLYSLSLNPPKEAQVSKAEFRAAIEKAEKKLGLSGQARAIVFHDKRGGDGNLRRHAHAVWCRIDPEKMKAVQMSSDRRKLQAVSRELYLEHGWKLPRGHMNPLEPDPRNFSLEEWQQAKRAKKDPKVLKAMFQECWNQSDGRAAFAQSLKERGYILAKGDRRGFVAVDYKGEVYPVSRWAGVKAKDVSTRLGELDNLPSVQKAHEQAAKTVTDRLKELQGEQNRIAQERLQRLGAERKAEIERQRAEKQRLAQEQAARKAKEEAKRLARLRKGLPGLLDRITGQRKRTLKQNELEAFKAQRRDKRECAALSQEQIPARQSFKAKAQQERSRHLEAKQELKADIENIEASISGDKIRRREQFKARRKATPRNRARDGPDFEW